MIIDYSLVSQKRIIDSRYRATSGGVVVTLPRQLHICLMLKEVFLKVLHINLYFFYLHTEEY